MNVVFNSELCGIITGILCGIVHVIKNFGDISVRLLMYLMFLWTLAFNITVNVGITLQCVQLWSHGSSEPGSSSETRVCHLCDDSV